VKPNISVISGSKNRPGTTNNKTHLSLRNRMSVAR